MLVEHSSVEGASEPCPPFDEWLAARGSQGDAAPAFPTRAPTPAFSRRSRLRGAGARDGTGARKSPSRRPRLGRGILRRTPFRDGDSVVGSTTLRRRGPMSFGADRRRQQHPTRILPVDPPFDFGSGPTRAAISVGRTRVSFPRPPEATGAAGRPRLLFLDEGLAVVFRRRQERRPRAARRPRRDSSLIPGGCDGSGGLARPPVPDAAPPRPPRPRRGAGGPPRPPRPRRGSVLVLRPLGLARRRRPPERVT